MSETARAVLRVDTSGICNNYARIQERVAPCQVMAVLKANAYGLGTRPVAEALLSSNVSRFGVACLDEALSIIDFGIPVQILGAVLPEEVNECVARNIVMPVSDSNSLDLIVSACNRQNKKARVHVLVDTGMGRLGVCLSQAAALIEKVSELDVVELEGVYSHFPSAFDDPEYSETQINQLLAVLDVSRCKPPLVHIANSDGINNIPSAFRPPFNMVRTGINLYGYFDAIGQRSMPISPVIELQAKLVAVRQLPAGSTVGYGRTYRLESNQKIGTVAIGYADGLPMQLAQGGELIVRGRRCPVIGRVSMDYTTILLDEVPQAEVGDWVTCLGQSLRLETWAEKKGTIPYDIICSLGRRVRREYF